MLVLSLRTRSIVRQFACWRRHAPAVLLALSVMLGQSLVWFLPDLWIAAGVVGLGVGLLVPGIRSLSWLIGGALLGIVSAFTLTSTSSINSTVRPAITAQSLDGERTVSGSVIGTPKHSRPGEVTFELLTGDGKNPQSIRCRAIDLPWRNAGNLEPGDTVWVRGSFNSVAKPFNPFSWEGWLWRRGISAECKAQFVSRSLYRETPLIYTWRELLKRRVFTALGDSQGTALFLSMALGYHDILSVPLEKAFTRLGLTHLLVVSGYQVSLAFGFILACSGIILARLRYGSIYLRSAMTVLAFFCAALYVVFIGTEMSAVRALLAAACICAQFLSERDTSFAQRWGVALLGMQLFWPWCFFDIGVVLTFAALLGIGLGSEVAARGRTAAFVCVTLAVWLCTSLVIVVWQGTISPLGLLLNLIVAAPWSILNCTVGLSALVIFLTGLPGAIIPLKVIGWVNQITGDLVLYLGESRYASWQTGGVLRIAIAAVVSVGIGCMILLFAAKRRVRL
jgi:ComEC/Rec2-related protein